MRFLVIQTFWQILYGTTQNKVKTTSDIFQGITIKFLYIESQKIWGRYNLKEQMTIIKITPIQITTQKVIGDPVMFAVQTTVQHYAIR